MFEKLRETVLTLPPAGAAGFEGLVAATLATLTDLTFRLAKSGSQFGRDASTPNAPFAIAMEAKRHTDSVSLETLTGKAAVAGLALEHKCDLWVICATSEVGDGTQRQVAEMLEKSGISLLTLDWGGHPIPQLAVLLASQSEITLKWFETNRVELSTSLLSELLCAVRLHESFEKVRQSLLKSVSASEVGLDSLRRNSRNKLQTKFAEPQISRASFGQQILVSSTTTLPTMREQTARILLEAENNAASNFVVVLGEEGVGKTWCVASRMVAQDNPPVLVFVAGRLKQLLDASSPEKSLARLLANQTGVDTEDRVTYWLKCIERWKSPSLGPTRRFLVVFDGLNEDMAMPWADILIGFAVLLKSLGGMLMITCRPVFWHRDVAPRLVGAVSPQVVVVEGYTEDELSDVLKRGVRDITSFNSRTREFLRNPRVCSVALHVLDTLDVTAAELTYEQLLLSYWEQRLRERGDLLSHNASDFLLLMRRHAKAWLAEGASKQFTTDDWLEHSGRAKKVGIESIRNDLTEIEEGRFLTLVDETHYKFRPETIPFALGMLIAEELKSLPDGVAPRDRLQQILGPVLGFETIGDIVSSAISLACITPSFPSAQAAALVETWFSIQNIRPDSYVSAGSYIRQRASAFFDAFELENFTGRHDWIADALLEERTSESVLTEWRTRIPKWLGAWSRETRSTSTVDDQSRAADRLKDIDEKLQQLLPTEKQLFDSVCYENINLCPNSLISVAARFLADQPLTPWIDAFIGRSLALSVARDFYDNNDDVVWILRLNRRDANEVCAAFESSLANRLSGASPPVKSAILGLYRATGSPTLGAIADEIAPIAPSQRWRAVESICSVNPYDPSTRDPNNLANAVRSISECNSSTVRSSFLTTSEDYSVESATPALSRFCVSPLVDKWREVIATLPQRNQDALRQLTFILPSLEPVFDSESLSTLRATYLRVISDTNFSRDDDLSLVVNFTLMALVPRHNPQEQFNLLRQSPAKVMEFVALVDCFDPMPCDDFDQILREAITKAAPVLIRRVLSFPLREDTSLSSATKSLIFDCMKSSNDLVVGAAFEAATRLTNDDLTWISTDAITGPLLCDEWARGCRSRLLATIAVRQKRPELLKFILPDDLEWCCFELGSEGAMWFLAVIESAIDRLLKPIVASPLTATQLSIHIPARENGRRMLAVEDLPHSSSATEAESIFKQIGSTGTNEIDEFATRQAAMWSEVRAFQNRLAADGATALCDSLSLNAAAKLADAFPGKVEEFLRRMLDSQDANADRNLYNFIIPLASALAASQEDLCERVFAKFRSVAPSVSVSYLPTGAPQYLAALFATPSSKLTALKKRVFGDSLNDSELEIGVICAEHFGSAEMLDGYVNNLCHSKDAGSIALGLAIASLRNRNPASDHIMQLTFKGQYLSDVSERARKNYEKNRWAQYWFECVASSTGSVDFWRFGNLAEGIVDKRYVHWCMHADATVSSRHRDLLTRFKSASRKRSKLREDTLFGHKAPSAYLRKALRAS